MDEILIVAGEADRVGQRLRHDLAEIGRRTQLLDGPAAARLFTIRVQPHRTLVEPTAAMFVRSSAWWYDFAAADADERFLRAEAYAAFWAATALSEAVVINRIAADGSVWRMTAGTLAAAGVQRDTASDIHASGPEIFETENNDDHSSALWGEDLEYRAAPIGELRRSEPLRARQLNPAALYEIVAVVGDRGFAATSDPRSAELAVIDRSIELCRGAGLHFATVSWAIDDSSAMPVRLNPAPEESELRYAWRDISRALCEELTR